MVKSVSIDTMNKRPTRGMAGLPGFLLKSEAEPKFEEQPHEMDGNDNIHAAYKKINQQFPKRSEKTPRFKRSEVVKFKATHVSYRSETCCESLK